MGTKTSVGARGYGFFYFGYYYAGPFGLGLSPHAGLPD